MGLDFSSKVQEVAKEIPSMEHILGNGLVQPFAGTNSGSKTAQYIE